MSKDFVSVNSLSSTDREKVKKTVLAIVESMTRTQAERDLVKDALTAINEELGVEKKVVRRMAKVAFNSSFDEEAAGNDAFETMYKVLFGDE